MGYKKIVSDNGSLIRFVTGKDKGRDAWYVILVRKESVADYRAAFSGDSVNLESYGRILASGWGASVPSEVVEELIDEWM